MGLLDDLNNETKIKRAAEVKCGFCQVLKTVTPAEAEKLSALMADDTIPKARISKILTENGLPVSRSTIYRHNRGECLGSAK